MSGATTAYAGYDNDLTYVLYTGIIGVRLVMIGRTATQYQSGQYAYRMVSTEDGVTFDSRVILLNGGADTITEFRRNCVTVDYDGSTIRLFAKTKPFSGSTESVTIFHTTNFGTTFVTDSSTVLVNPDNTTLQGITYGPAPGYLMTYRYVSGTGSVVHRSTDGGATLEQVWSGNTILSQHQWNSADDGVLFGGGSGGENGPCFIYTNNFGDTFDELHDNSYGGLGLILYTPYNG
jgi:hypothetical protein